MTPDDPTLIVAVYGPHARWLGPFLESALATGHRRFIVVTDGGAQANAEDLVKWAFEGSVVQATAVAEDPDFAAMLRDPKLAPFAYLAAWRRAYRLLSPGERFVCLHVDTLVQRNLAACWQEVSVPHFGLALPTRRQGGRSVFDPTMLCGVAAPIVGSELAALLRETVRQATSNNREQIFQQYGSFPAAALALLHARSEEGTGTVLAQLQGKAMPWIGTDAAPCGVHHFKNVMPHPNTEVGRRWLTLTAAYDARQTGVTA